MFESQPDQAGECGLIERIGDDRLGQHLPRLRAGTHVSKPLGNGQEVVCPQVGLAEEIGELELGRRGIAEAVVSHGLEPVEEGVVVLGPVGMHFQQLARQFKRTAIISLHDQGFDGEKGRRFQGRRSILQWS